MESRSSIGVELEFVVAVAPHDSELNVPEMFQNSTGAPIILPPGVAQYGVTAIDLIRQRGERTLRNAVAERRGTRVVQSEEETSQTEAIHLQTYREWNFGSDASVYLAPDEIQQQFINDYQWYAVEISSPALFATAESFDEIREVVNSFQAEYWIITPRAAGMHYHYGNGINYIPFEKLRRMAALLVAVDPLLVQLHPQRKANEFCLSNRLYSRIAHGTPAAVVAREIGATFEEAAPEFPGSRPRPIPVARPFRRRTPSLLVFARRGDLEGYEFDEFFYTAFRESGYEYGDLDEDARPLEIAAAVREILRCTNAPTVAELMRYAPIIIDRPAYSFNHYTLALYKRPQLRNGEILRDYQQKRTVEFRQMAATMDAECVVAHGKIIVRLCEIAAQINLEELFQIALDCSVAESHGNWFDVFDLLAELDLEAEARVLQYPLAQYRGETIPETIVDDQAQAKAAEKRDGQRLSWLRWLGRGFIGGSG